MTSTEHAALSAAIETNRAPEAVAKDFSYVDAAFDQMRDGDTPAPFWRALHWGLFADPDSLEHRGGDPDRYYAAGEAMTEAVVAAAGIADTARILDVGCGFGGTLDHIAARNQGCALAGLNIDERQLRRAGALLAEFGRGHGGPIPFITGDGCRLPIATATLDHVLAVECLFHFPSRKAFFKEVARVLKPGGTLALSDFIAAPGALAAILARLGEGSPVTEDAHADDAWYGHQSKPPTSATYARLGRAVGLDVIIDDDVTRETMPTYPALRRIYVGTGQFAGAASVTALEDLARGGLLGYHVIAFRKRPA